MDLLRPIQILELSSRSVPAQAPILAALIRLALPLRAFRDDQVPNSQIALSSFRLVFTRVRC
jgi:hypothetical protein